MRIRNIQIRQWRHFENIKLQLDDDAGLVCIVGANGTGKSHLLELIAACAHRVGLSPGIKIPRGDPFSDMHDFSIQFHLAAGVSNAVDEGLADEPAFQAWDRTLTISSQKSVNTESLSIEAGGIEEHALQISFANRVIKQLQQSKNVHLLSLDADRAYPKKAINAHEVAQAFEINWAGDEYKRGSSFKTTAMLYDEWLKYFLAQENQCGAQLMQELRQAKKDGTIPPEFEDHFEAYTASLKKVLPHVAFTGVDPKEKTLLFDTTGIKLTFNQLSGGEREIAFLIGQIDRFGLRHGLFLLDEPELHLNSDLIRTWVSYLTSTVETGQIWLATHSLEAVEAAGQQATFILERNEQSRKVNSMARLDTRPVLSALSRAVGTPAFSLSELIFVFVEGEESVGERERFRKLAGMPQNTRFMECGSCKEVLRRVATIKAIANEVEVGIRIGGVIDRDFRSNTEVRSPMDRDIFVLPVHEVENFFLHPPTVKTLLEQNGRDHLDPLEIVRNASDARAGSWVFQHAMATKNAKSLPGIAVAAKRQAKSLDWAQFDGHRNEAICRITGKAGYDDDTAQRLKSILEISLHAYVENRDGDGLWRSCEGKQVLSNVASVIGFAGPTAMIQATFAAWERENADIPEELKQLREYLLTI